MKIDVLLGLQWGDEGKGKVVDVLTSGYDIIARFQGGPNAGHSLSFGDTKHVLHSIPSGVFHDGVTNVIGNGVVLDPIVFKKEIEALEKIGINPYERIKISTKTHLILPTHRMLDAASEAAKGKQKIGSTLRGIGPAYMDKTGRNGLRVGDIGLSTFQSKYQQLRKKHTDLLRMYAIDSPTIEEDGWWESIEFLKKFDWIDSAYFLQQHQDKKILAEGAQGTLLDIEFGSYPFVTSSHTVSSGACTGLGVPPTSINKVFGITKAYCTRVGSGPFPTELLDKTGEALQKAGNEFGATTGRPRRCGWLDLVALKYALMINGVSELIVTKLDVLSGFDTIKIATAYKIDGKVSEEFPYSIDQEIEPIYEEFAGWKEDISKVQRYEDLPEAARAYISFITKHTQVPVSIISTGPDRNQVIHVNQELTPIN